MKNLLIEKKTRKIFKSSGNILGKNTGQMQDWNPVECGKYPTSYILPIQQIDYWLSGQKQTIIS